MKTFKIVLAGLLSLTLAGAFAACTQEGETYTFTFDTRGGSAIAPLELAEGEKVTRPADPTHNFYSQFDGWYSDAACTTEYTFGTMPAQDVTVYAHWSGAARSVRVSYDSMGGTQVEPSIGRAGSAFSVQPAAPARQGYVFMGWYTDETFTTPFVFDVFPQENTTLYANWVADTGNYVFVTYFGNGRQLGEPVPVQKNTAFAAPDFFGDGIVSGAWYTDPDFLDEYEGGTLTGDIRLYTYYYTEGLTFENGSVTGYAGENEQVIVPSVYDDVPVTMVSEGAFRDSSVTSVLLPESIQEVEAYAFYNCRYLETINLSENVTYLGDYAFAKAVRLKEYGDISSLAAIPAGCFMGCAELQSVTLPASLKTVSDYAFADCELLGTVTLPASVTYVGDQAFSGCTLLTSVTMPASVVTLGADVFAGCKSLAQVQTEGSGDLTVEGGNLYFGSKLIRCFAGEGTFTLPEGKTQVAAYAFENAPAFTEAVFPAGTTLERNALKGLDSLVSLTLPEVSFGGESYLAAAFGAAAPETEGVRSYYIPMTLTSVTLTSADALGDYAFFGANALESVGGTENITKIGEGAFAYTALSYETYTLPANVTAFGARVFEGCQVGSYAVAAGNTAFQAEGGCLYEGSTLVAVPVSLTSVTVKEGTTKIGAYAFYNSAVRELVLPDTVTSVGFAALGNMHALVSLTTPVIGDGGSNSYMGYVFGSEMVIEQSSGYAGIRLSRPSRLPSVLASVTVTKDAHPASDGKQQIPDMAFAYLTSLMSVTLTDTPVRVYGAFSYYMTSVTEADFEGVEAESVETADGTGWTIAIGEAAFRGTKLKEVSLPGTLKGGAGAACFAEIEGLERITLAEGIVSISNAMFYASYTAGEAMDDGYTYNIWHSSVGSVVIPASVGSIGQEAFYGVGMTEYAQPVSPEQQPGAETQGTRVEGFTLTFAAGSELQVVYANAFSGCGAETLALPASLALVGQGAMSDMLFLTSVTFGSAEEGSSLALLYDSVFSGCAKLESITFYGENVPAVTGDAADIFGSEESGAILYVMDPEAWKAADGWKDLADRIRKAEEGEQA